MKVAQLCPTLCNLMEVFSVHGIFQARTLEWVAIPFSRESCQPRDRTQVSSIASRFFTVWATRSTRVRAKTIDSVWKQMCSDEGREGVMCLQAKEHQGLPTVNKARREAWDGFFLRASRRNHSCQQLGFRSLASTTVRNKFLLIKV